MAIKPQYSPFAPLFGCSVTASYPVCQLLCTQSSTGDLAQIVLHLLEEAVVAGGLVGGNERVDVGELGPRQRQHFRCAANQHVGRSSTYAFNFMVHEPSGIIE